MIWSEELSARLAYLWKRNSASEIAALLNSEGYDVSRNAVIGRAHRMKLPPKQLKPIQKSAAGGPKMKKDARLRAAPGAQVQAINRGHKISGDGYKPKTVEVATLDIRLVDLEPMQCRFACVRIDNEWRFCGHRTYDGSSYCEAHHALCWSRPVAATKQNPIYRETKRRAA